MLPYNGAKNRVGEFVFLASFESNDYVSKGNVSFYKNLKFNRSVLKANQTSNQNSSTRFLSYVFVKKYLLVGASGILWADGSVDQRCMYVTPIRLDVVLHTSQISCCKGKWYVRRFDPDTVENGHIYSSGKEE